MNNKYKMKLHCIAFVIALLIPVSTFAHSDGKDNKEIVNLPADNLVWKVTPEGAAFATLQGNRFEEAYRAMVKLPAGLVSPLHTKSANMYGVVLSGTFSHIAIGADPSTEVLLPAGSYYKIPANLPHISKCVSTSDCVSYLYQDGKFDFITNLEAGTDH